MKFDTSFTAVWAVLSGLKAACAAIPTLERLLTFIRPSRVADQSESSLRKASELSPRHEFDEGALVPTMSDSLCVPKKKGESSTQPTSSIDIPALQKGEMGSAAISGTVSDLDTVVMPTSSGLSSSSARKNGG